MTAFFARRYSEPQLAADLTSEVFLQALASLDSYPPLSAIAAGAALATGESPSVVLD